MLLYCIVYCILKNSNSYSHAVLTVIVRYENTQTCRCAHIVFYFSLSSFSLSSANIYSFMLSIAQTMYRLSNGVKTTMTTSRTHERKCNVSYEPMYSYEIVLLFLFLLHDNSLL